MRSHRASASFEMLENRLFLSAVHVADFGAHPNDGGDDHDAIQAAINTSHEGDTIVFDSGSYQVSGSMKFKTSRTYAGATGTP